ncbi:MAG: bifunctional 4-hydroxy-2-oxoglutarate aldolase/2-dehydro-3-deoxy-phosphogluconate aldolase [Burkholderiales bacterium]
MIRVPKSEVVRRIGLAGWVAIVRCDSTEEALRIGEGCALGGAAAVEVTFSVPNATDVIRALTGRFGTGDLLVGAGTVLNPAMAREALDAGAQYIISPHFNPATVAFCVQQGVVAMPGAMTPTEIVAAHEAGADVIKIFPGEIVGAAFIRAVRAPLPHIPLMPTGGVTLDNIAQWFDAGVFAVGIGSYVSAPAKQGDLAGVAKRARELTDRIRAIRAEATS